MYMFELEFAQILLRSCTEGSYGSSIFNFLRHWQSSVSTVYGEKKQNRNCEKDWNRDAKWSRDKTRMWSQRNGQSTQDGLPVIDSSRSYTWLPFSLNSVRQPWILITYPSFFVRLECVLIIHDSQKIMMHWVSMVLCVQLSPYFCTILYW